jgi:hypothetical protein
MNPQSRQEQKLAPFSSRKNQNRKDLQKEKFVKNAHIKLAEGNKRFKVKVPTAGIARKNCSS